MLNVLASKCMHNFSPNLGCLLTPPKNTLAAKYAPCRPPWTFLTRGCV